MDDGITIRLAKEQDYDAVAGLYAADEAATARELPVVFREPRGALLRSAYVSGLSPNRQSWGFYVAEDAGQVVGVLEVSRAKLEATRDRRPLVFAAIDGLFVLAGHDQLGIRQRLLERAVEWASAHKLPAVFMTTYPMQPEEAQACADLGFETFNTNMIKYV